MGSLTKGLIGKEDMEVQSNTNATETFERTSSTGGTLTLKKIPDIWDGAGKISVAEVDTTTIEVDNLSISNITATPNVQGDIYYHDGTEVQRLAAGTSGEFLKTQGAGANPTWYNVRTLLVLDIPSKNLVTKYVSATTVDIDATHIIIEGWKEDTLNLTVDITASGANGLDTGAEANSTWYYIYVIYNITTDTYAGLLSASSSSPTLPSGYTEYRLVSYVYNGAGGDFTAFTHIGDVYQYNVPTIVLNNGNQTNATEIDLSTVVPVNIKEVFGWWMANTNIVYLNLHPVTFVGTNTVYYHTNSADTYASTFRLLLTVDQSMFYTVSGNTADIYVSGFTTREAY